jgi:predicted nucleic acid-binding protein
LRAYADTSFIIKLAAREHDAEQAVAEYRRHGLPPLFYVGFHALEAENAIRQNVFQLRRSLPSRDRKLLKQATGATFARLRAMLDRKRLIETTCDWDSGVERARALSQKHTEGSGVGTLDLLHVAFALELESELFFSTDQRQAKLARAEGLEVAAVLEKE